MEWRATENISPCKKMFLNKKVPIDVIMIESDDAPNVIAEEVETRSISKLVIESSSTPLFSSKLQHFPYRTGTSSTCTVYAITNRKLQSVRPSDSDKNESSRDDRSDTTFPRTNSSFMNSTIQTDAGSGVTSYYLSSYSMPTQTFQALATVSESLLHHGMNSLVNYRTREVEDVGISCPVNSEIGSPIDPNSSYCNSTVGNCSNSTILDHDPDLNLYDASLSECQQEFFNLELEKLKIELRHVQGMHAVAQMETLDASRKISELNRRRLDKVARRRKKGKTKP
ncbi:hypothetical protein QQ045_000765 [Rhodiola kirilowii]